MVSVPTTRWRWAVVAAVAAVLVAAPVALTALPASARMDPSALRARVLASMNLPYQGYAEATGSLGLPDLPNLSSVTSLLGGTTRLRAWYVAPEHWRVDEITGVGERDTYAVPGSQFVWDNGQNQYTQVLGDEPIRLPRGADLLPPDLARRVLKDEDKVAALPARLVAGIDAAGLRVTPRSTQTTVAYIDVWADPKTGLPLEVAVTGRGARDPFLATRFLEVNLTAPDAALLTPPTVHGDMGYVVADSADVTNALTRLGTGPLPDRLAGQPRVTASAAALTGVGNYGTGLAQFLVLPLPRRAGFDVIRRITRANGTPLTYPTGRGVQISTPLLSVLAVHTDLTEQSYLMVGLVEPKLLRQAATDLVAYPGGP